MPSNAKIVEQMRDRQARMFRIAQDPQRYGLTLKMIQIDSGLGYDSLRNYASGETIMPITAVDALVDVIPDELLSLLLPAGHLIVRVVEGINHDELESVAREFVSTKAATHHPDSECGREIGPNENVVLLAKAAKIKAVAA